MKRKLLFISVGILMMTALCIRSFAVSSVPYHTYNYDYWKSVLYPAAYVPTGTYSGRLGNRVVQQSQDIFVADDGRLCSGYWKQPHYCAGWGHTD